MDVLTGVRFTNSFARIGGVANDMSDEVIAMLKEYVEQFPEKIHECEKLVLANKIFIDRCQGVGYISKEEAIGMGVTGPIIRGSGIEHDIRKDHPYLIYSELDFNIPVFTEGDVLARFYVRLNEMKESIKILRQCLEKIPAGQVNANQPKKVLPQKERTYSKMEELIHDFMLINFGINPPIGEVYNAIEGSKGELGFYIVSDGSANPWRLKIRSPSFCNLQSMPLMIKGNMISDIVAIIGSVDPVMGEADK